MRSFSDRSRPARNSLRASSDVVVIAILPSPLAFALFPIDAVVLFGSTWHPASTSKTKIRLNDLRRDIVGSLPGLMRGVKGLLCSRQQASKWGDLRTSFAWR